MTNLSDFGNARIGAVSSLNPGVGQFEDIANAAIFLSSDDAKFIIGYMLIVNDGFTAPF